MQDVHVAMRVRSAIVQAALPLWLRHPLIYRVTRVPGAIEAQHLAPREDEWRWACSSSRSHPHWTLAAGLCRREDEHRMARACCSLPQWGEI